MITLILTAILLISLIGIGVILFRKIPVLVKLPEVKFSSEPPLSKIKIKIKKGVVKGVVKIPGAERFDYELYLQKMLSKIRILTLKTEQKTGSWLERLRQKRNNHNHNHDQYWEELKKAKDGK